MTHARAYTATCAATTTGSASASRATFRSVLAPVAGARQGVLRLLVFELSVISAKRVIEIDGSNDALDSDADGNRNQGHIEILTG